jgi:hypothetical protein
MLSEPIPLSSASANAVRRTRSRFSGVPASAAGLVDHLQRKQRTIGDTHEQNSASQSIEATPMTGTPQKMSAIVQDGYGTVPAAALRLAAIARPTIGDDQVLVRVAAASVDRGTWHVMTGVPYAIRLAGFGVRAPKAPNPGRALAGTVEAVGKDVTEFKPGDEVYGTCDG